MDNVAADAATAAEASPPRRRFADLPGPPALPVFGSALAIDKSSAHHQFAAWAERYGRYYRVRIGPRHILVISDHAVISSVLRDRPQRFRRPKNHAAIVREMGFDEGLFFANDEVWKRQRRMVMAALDPGHVKSFLPMLLTVAERLRRRWQQAALAGTEFDLQADLMRYTVDVVAGLAFGTDVNTLESDEDVIQRHLNRIFPALNRRVIAPFPYWRYVKLPRDRALDRSVREVKAAIERFIGMARERLAADPSRRERPTNLLEAMIVAAEASGEAGADGDVAGNVFIMLVAGEDTTANTLAWLFEFLHRHPEATARAREEVRRVAPDLSRLTLNDVSELRFVDACIQETLRLKPVAPLLPSQAVADTVVGDVEVPAGTFVMGLMRADAIDARYFSEPLAFAPDRWLDGAADARAPGRVSMPFGAGGRLCPGRYLALVEMKIAVCMLLANFTIERVGTRDGAPARELMNFAMAPVGLRMTLSTVDNAAPRADAA